MSKRDPDHCPKSESGKHVIDLDTLHVDWDGDTAYIDVNCRFCGRSGCIGKLSQDDTGEFQVDW